MSVKSVRSTAKEFKEDVLPWKLDYDAIGEIQREFSGKLTVEDVAKAFGGHKISGFMVVPYFEALVCFAEEVKPVRWRMLSEVGKSEMGTFLVIYRNKVIARLEHYVEIGKLTADKCAEIVARMGDGPNFTKNRKRAISNIFHYDKIGGSKPNLDRLKLCQFTSAVLVKLHDIMTVPKPSKARRIAELGEDIVQRYESLRSNKDRSYIWSKKFALGEEFHRSFPRRDNPSNLGVAEDDTPTEDECEGDFFGQPARDNSADDDNNVLLTTKDKLRKVQAAIIKKKADIEEMEQRVCLSQQDLVKLELEEVQLNEKLDAEVQDCTLASYLRDLLTTDEVKENPQLYEEKLNFVYNIVETLEANAEAANKTAWDIFVERFPEANNYRKLINFSQLKPKAVPLPILENGPVVIQPETPTTTQKDPGTHTATSSQPIASTSAQVAQHDMENDFSAVKIPQHKSITASDRSIQPYLAQQTVPFIPNLSGIPQPHIPSLVGVNIPHNPFPEITEPQIVPRKKRPRKQSSSNVELPSETKGAQPDVSGRATRSTRGRNKKEADKGGQGAAQPKSPIERKTKKAKKDAAALPSDVIPDNDIPYTEEVTSGQVNDAFEQIDNLPYY